MKDEIEKKRGQVCVCVCVCAGACVCAFFVSNHKEWLFKLIQFENVYDL